MIRLEPDAARRREAHQCPGHRGALRIVYLNHHRLVQLRTHSGGLLFPAD
jgi:hypothetical protein